MLLQKTHIEAKQARRVEGPCYWLLYDGQCPLCQCTVEWVRRLDTRRLILPLDLHSQWQQISHRAPNLTQEDLIESVHLIAPDGRVWSGFDASRKLATLLPLLWPAVPWLYVPGASRCGDRMYRLISRHRHWLTPRSCEAGVCGPDKP